MHIARTGLLLLWGLALICLHPFALTGQAFIIDPNANYWLETASGSRSGNGDPAIFTWSLAPNGTSISDNSIGVSDTSDLISTFDNFFGSGPGGSDLTQRPWFSLFEDSLNRWSEVSGATYIYEPNDDGLAINGSTSSIYDGELGERGDIRIGGTSVDGSSDTLAYNYFPDSGDMVVDTDDISFYLNSSNNYRAVRNVLMHELGHGFGLEHVESSTDNLLMEPFIDTSFDGPQLDDIRGIQYYFGDAYEKTNGGLGNDTAALATSLGSLSQGQGLSVGSDADVPDQTISSDATDFVSLANLNDTDYYSFTVDEPGLLDASLIPHGGIFTQSGQGGSPSSFDASARVDLILTIFDTNGTTILETADFVGLGGTESINGLVLDEAGEYFARISGSDDTVQLYELELDITDFLEADFNLDGEVDELDLAVWQDAFNTTAAGDADNDGDSDGEDFLVWQRQFGMSSTILAASTIAVPEPSSLVLLACISAWALQHRKRI